MHFHRLIPLIAACCLAACSDPVLDMALSPQEKARMLALQNPFGEHLVRFSGAGGVAVVLGVGAGCKLYRAELAQGVVVAWQRVDEVAAANFLSGGGCQVRRFGVEGAYLHLEYCAQAVGAGGGCGGGSGRYRSADGLRWERETERQGWQPLG